METALDISAHRAADGDAVLVSGYLGNHHACIQSGRLGIANDIRSDCAPLCEMVRALPGRGHRSAHTLRDITRGGLASVLSEIAEASGVGIHLAAGLTLAEPRGAGVFAIFWGWTRFIWAMKAS